MHLICYLRTSTTIIKRSLSAKVAKTNDFLKIVTFIAFDLHVHFKIIKRSFSLRYQVNINAFNIAINRIVMSPSTVYSSYNKTLKGMQMCINVLVQIYTSAYFDMDLFTKALEITWAKPMYMKYIFLCEGGMHLLITGFASIGYLHGKARLGELSFEWYFLVKLAYFFDVSAVDSVKQKLSGKECDKPLRTLSVIMPCLFLTVFLG